jgi:hypothetical protein
VFGRFLVTGFEHILDGLDHLLFLFILVIPVLKIRPLVVVITAFTLAHSLTLAASLFDLVPKGLWFPPLVELAIAASILYMALANLFRSSLRGSLGGRVDAPPTEGSEIGLRWMVAFAFGLVHGFGFSFALADSLQFAGNQQVVSLLGFNLGVEFGQILVVVVLASLLRLATRWLSHRALILLLSALIAHTAWHWMVERWVVFDAYRIVMPALDTQLLSAGMRWLMLMLSAALIVWLLRPVFERWASASPAPASPGASLPKGRQH